MCVSDRSDFWSLLALKGQHQQAQEGRAVSCSIPCPVSMWMPSLQLCLAFAVLGSEPTPGTKEWLLALVGITSRGASALAASILS